MKASIIGLLPIFLFTTRAFGADYYVSTTGSDSNSGTLRAPFQTLTHGTSVLQPGDTLHIRGGVYHEAVKLGAEGTSAAPITIKAFNSENVILDGGLYLETQGVTRLRAPEPELNNNPNWDKLVKVTIDKNLVPEGRLELVEGLDFMRVAQFPNASHKVFPYGRDFQDILVGHGQTEYIENEVLGGKEADYWTGKIYGSRGQVVADYKSNVAFWSHKGNNEIYYKNVESSSENRIYPERGLPHPVAVDLNNIARTDAFAIQNHPDALDEPGEYVYYEDGDAYTIYMWPYDQGANGSDLQILAKSQAIIPRSGRYGSHIAIEGLTIQNYGVRGDHRAGGIIYPKGFSNSEVTLRNLKIRNIVGHGVSINSCTDAMVDGLVVRNVKGKRGILLYCDGATIQNSNVDVIERTGIALFRSTNSKILGNTVGDLGQHGNGISVYLGSDNALVKNNYVESNNIPFTSKHSKNITVMDNIFLTEGKKVVSDWGSGGGYFRALNNILLAPASAGRKATAIALGSKFDEMTIANNILSGAVPSKANRFNNVYTLLGWSQKSRYGWAFGPGEVHEEDLSKIFAGDSRRLSSDSIALGAGAEVDSFYPAEVHPRVDFDLDFYGNQKQSPLNIGPEASATNTNQSVLFDQSAVPNLLSSSEVKRVVGDVSESEGVVTLNTRSSRVELERDDAYFGNSDFEVSFDFKRSDSASKGRAVYFSGSFVFYIGNYISVIGSNASGDSIHLKSSRVEADLGWHSASYRYSSSTGEASLFVDGVLVSSKQGYDAPQKTNSSRSIFLGSPFGGSFDGSIRNLVFKKL